MGLFRRCCQGFIGNEPEEQHVDGGMARGTGEGDDCVLSPLISSQRAWGLGSALLFLFLTPGNFDQRPVLALSSRKRCDTATPLRPISVRLALLNICSGSTVPSNGRLHGTSAVQPACLKECYRGFSWGEQMMSSIRPTLALFGTDIQRSYRLACGLCPRDTFALLYCAAH